MAKLEFICFIPHRSEVVEGCVKWSQVQNCKVIDGLPQIVWDNLTPWREANLWLCERATIKEVNLKTVVSNARALYDYANWLETGTKTGTKWWDFPQRKAAPENRDLVFLTRFGNAYALRGLDKSPAINVAMNAFRKLGVKRELLGLRFFHFHQSRCTFATELARLAIRSGGSVNAIAIVMEAMLHKDEATALRYIKFVEKTPVKETMANVFSRACKWQ